MMSDSLQFQLSAALRKGLHVYALVDPSLVDSDKQRLPGGNHDRVAVVPAGVSLEGSDALSVLPYLLPLDCASKHHSRQLSRLIEWGLDFHSVTWLASLSAASALAPLLAQRMDAMLTGQQAALLRFCDSRILPVV